jgi:serine/threonine protein kinase
MLNTGTLLHNRYLIARPLGQGGMGAVYEAVDQKFGSTVAVKQMTVSGEAMVRAFEREARLLNGLRHAALPVVIDYFSEPVGLFLVMQFIPGEDFGKLLEQNGGPFHHSRVFAWADQLLSALEYLHSRQPPIIHRDIKPQNLKLTPEGDLILLDFGLAKGSTGPRTGTTGSIIAYTPLYAALEQINGQGASIASDLYSVSATVYHLLTGVPPVDVLTRVDMLFNRRPDPLRTPHEINSSVPKELSDVIVAGLAVSKDERPASATAMRHALRNPGGSTIREASPSAPPPAQPHVPSAAPSAAQADRSAKTTAETADETMQLDPSFAAAVYDQLRPEARQEGPSAPVATAERGAGGAAELPEPTPPSRSGTWIGIALAAGLGFVVLVSAGALAIWRPWEAGGPPATVPAPEASGPQPTPSPEPPAPGPPVTAMSELVRFRLEDSDGATLRADTPIPTGRKFRFRFASDAEGFVYLVAPDASGSYTTFLTNSPAAATQVKTNAVGTGRDVVFPGGAASLSVTQGATRFLVFMTTDREAAPEFLKGESLARLSPDQVKQLETWLSSSAHTEKREGGGWTRVSSGGHEGKGVGFEIVVTGR